MTTFSPMTRWLLCLAVCVASSSVPSSHAQLRSVPRSAFRATTPDEMKPGDGATQVVLMGDPTKPGVYVVQNTFAPGRGSRPHFHDQDRYITVVKGTWWVALGPEADTYDPSRMVPMKAGSFVFHPAFGHHYDMAKDEEAVVRIMGMGPVTSTQLDAQERK